MEYIWLVRTTPTLLLICSSFRIGKMVIQAAHECSSLSTAQLEYKKKSWSWSVKPHPPPKKDILGGSSQDLDTWLVTMVTVVSPLRMGLWDPFQMAFWWLINGGDPNYLHPLGWSSKYPPLPGVLVNKGVQLLIPIRRVLGNHHLFFVSQSIFQLENR